MRLAAARRRFARLRLPRRWALLAVLASAAVAPSARADRVVPKKGAPVRGVVTRTDVEVVVNRYRAKSAAMTYGVQRFPADQVKRVEEDPPSAETIRRRREDLAAGDVPGRLGLARYAIAQKIPREATRTYLEALALEPTNAEALAALGGREKVDAQRRGDPTVDPALHGALAAYLATTDGPARAAAAARLEAAFGFPARSDLLDRARRSAQEPKGLREDVPLRMRDERHPGAVCSLYVPPDYDPLVPRPLLIGLHDAGAGGREGTTVVGSGRDGLTLYLQGAQARGWLLACPTAVAPLWAGGAATDWLDDVLDEVSARFAVDLDRVFVVGHGTGGTAAVTHGLARPEVFAGFGASSAPALPPAVAAARSGTAVYLYHADDDPSAAVDVSRTAADALLRAGVDVVYLELTGQGHAFPSEGLRELMDVLRGKRLADARRSVDAPRSSLTRPVSPAERKAFGDPAAGGVPPAK